jgi:hypothetical protein
LGSTSAVDVTPNEYEQVIKILINDREMTTEDAREQITLLEDISDRVLNWKFSGDHNQMFAYDHLVMDVRDTSKSRMNAIYAQSEDMRDQIMIEHVKAAKARNVQYIDNFFFGSSLNKNEEYKKYGFKITYVSRYYKSI